MSGVNASSCIGKGVVRGSWVESEGKELIEKQGEATN